ncbi:MAG: fibronectin type III domain-containing protein [Treponema sp.]|nr:fibronectin type III domain-containing protein [Treponema sp.]
MRGGALLLILLTGCENFLKGPQIKNELEERIAYANAKSYLIVVQADKGSGDIRKPIGGEVSKKVTDSFTIAFDPDEDYIFKGWSVSSTELPKGADINDYIFIEDPASLETTVTFKKALEKIVIKAVCPPIPYAQVYIDGSNGKLSPSKGTYTFRQNHQTFLSFEPDPDYEFLTWKVYNGQTELTNQEYVVFDDATKETTNCTLAAPVPEGVNLCIKPYVVVRPQVLSYWPMYDTAKGSLSDTTIEVVFDHDIDPESILYSEEDDDYKELVARGITDFKESKIYRGRYYGYQDGEEVYLKNIEITDKRTGKTIAQYFGEPIFEDPTTLYIPVENATGLTTGMIVIVNVSKDFHYEDTITKKPVTMTKSEKWRYLSNGTTDKKAPIVNGCQQDATEVTTVTCNMSGKKNGQDKSYEAKGRTSLDLSNDSDWEWLKDYYFTDKSAVTFAPCAITVTDADSYPASMFTLEYTKIYDENYNEIEQSDRQSKTLSINYDYALGTTAKYSGSHSLKNLDDGVYAVRYIFKDRSNNERYVPSKTKYWWFAVDTKTPVPTGNFAEDDSDSARTTSSVTINLPEPAVDVESCSIEYRTYDSMSGAGSAVTKTISPTDTTVELTGLTAGTRYQVRGIWTDKAGNTYTTSYNDVNAYTKPNRPSISASQTGVAFITVSWSPVQNGCEEYHIYYTSKDGAINKCETCLDTITSYVLNVPCMKEYEIYVTAVAYGVESDKSYPRTVTIPPANVTNLTVTGQKETGYPTRAEFTITWTHPTRGEYDKLYLYFSNDLNFNNNLSNRTLIIDISNERTGEIVLDRRNMSNYDPDGTFGNLVTGQRYYVKVKSVAEIGDETVEAPEVCSTPPYCIVDSGFHGY